MKKEERLWALILGGSSGLGLATAKKLAQNDYNIIVVHRNRKSDLQQVKFNFQEITSKGAQLKSFNVDATREEKRAEIIAEISKFLHSNTIKVVVHSIAKGNLKPMYTESGPSLTASDFAMTINAMATSLYDWSSALIDQKLIADDARIIAFTSEGNTKAWPGYGAISAAKVTLEAIVRNMALEFAPLGITANCIQAGLTDTQSFRMIPGSEGLKQNALKRNPSGRLTTPEDVANAAYLLCLKEARWITGTVIKVDGGESLQ